MIKPPDLLPRAGISFLIIFLFASIKLQSQVPDSVRRLESNLDQMASLEKLEALVSLMAYYEDLDIKKAVKYGKQSVSLAEAFDLQGNESPENELVYSKMEAHRSLGNLYAKQKKYRLARKQLTKSRDVALLLQDSIVLADLNGKLRRLDEQENGNFFSRQLKKINVPEKLVSGAGNIKLSSVLAIAKKYEQLNQYNSAIDQYKKAIPLARNAGDIPKIAELQEKIASLYLLIEGNQDAAAFYQMSIRTYKNLGDSIGELRSQQALSQMLDEQQFSETSEEQRVESPEEGPLTVGEIKESIASYEQLAKTYENQRDFDQSLKYYKQYQKLQLELLGREKQRELDSLRMVGQTQEIIVLAHENELNEFELLQRSEELERQERFRNALFAGALVLLVLLLIFWRLFTSKRKAHRDLTVTYTNLDLARKKLVAAELKIKKLLGQQVSEDIAKALISNNADDNTVQKHVCIMFLDIRGFTPFANSRSPKEVIAYQNDVFGFMIDIISKYHGVVNQFMGDGFMATFGAPVSYEDDIENAYKAAFEIVQEVNHRSKNGLIPTTRIGIGLHAGEVVAGNVGTEVRKQYSITGTTVITAARIEQLNKEFTSQLLISETVAEALNGLLPNDVTVYETSLKGFDKPMKIFKVA